MIYPIADYAAFAGFARNGFIDMVMANRRYHAT